jgi:fluoride exporter
MAALWVIAAMSVAGGIGAGCRFVLDGFVKARVRLAYPVGTTIINVTGSFLLGLVTALALAHAVPLEWRLILGTGFLGGYKTLSTASLETVRLAQEGRWRASALNAFGMLAGSLLAAALGLWLGGLAA